MSNFSVLINKEDRPGRHGFTRGISVMSIATVGRRIIVGRLIKQHIVMMILHGMINIYALHPRQVDRNPSASTTITPLQDSYPTCMSKY